MYGQVWMERVEFGEHSSGPDPPGMRGQKATDKQRRLRNSAHRWPALQAARHWWKMTFEEIPLVEKAAVDVRPQERAPRHRFSVLGMWS